MAAVAAADAALGPDDWLAVAAAAAALCLRTSSEAPRVDSEDHWRPESRVEVAPAPELR